MPGASAHPAHDGRTYLRRLAPGSLLLLAVLGGGAPVPVVAPAPLASRTLAGLVGVAEPPPVTIDFASGGLERAAPRSVAVPAVAVPGMSAAPRFIPQSHRFLSSSCDPPVGSGR